MLTFLFIIDINRLLNIISTAFINQSIINNKFFKIDWIKFYEYNYFIKEVRKYLMKNNFT